MLAREAVELAGATDSPVLRAKALLVLADVLQRAGRSVDATAAAREAAELAGHKGLVPTEERPRALSDASSAAAAARGDPVT
jgi:hypothetical protein